MPSNTQAAPKTKSFGKKGQTRTIAKKTPKSYPTEKVAHKFRPHKHHNATKLRASITPGTVLIILAGRFAGRRVVFLNQTKEGLLLVTGPYQFNGVPVRRVPQHLVIATSTKVDVNGVDTTKFDDAYFKKSKDAKHKKSEVNFFAEAPKKKEIDAHRIEDQKTVDAKVVEAIKKVPQLEAYITSMFTLTAAPHTLKF